MKIFFVMLGLLIVSACAHKPVERVITKTEYRYREIPAEYMTCLPPITRDDLAVLGTSKESEYNAELVLPLFDNNLVCYQSMNRIKEFNEETKLLNQTPNQ